MDDLDKRRFGQWTIWTNPERFGQIPGRFGQKWTIWTICKNGQFGQMCGLKNWKMGRVVIIQLTEQYQS